MCATREPGRTNEHVYPAWLIRHLGLKGAIRPVHFDPLGRRITERGPISLQKHLNGQVCGACNGGWMSAPEGRFKLLYEGPRAAAITADARRTIARWFAKTSVVINTSQPYRLMWPAGARHQAARRVPADVRVWRCRRPDGAARQVSWAQGTPMAIAFGMGQAELALMSQAHLAVIEAGDLVGVLLRDPSRRLWSTDELAAVWPPDGGLDWSDIPVCDESVARPGRPRRRRCEYLSRRR